MFDVEDSEVIRPDDLKKAFNKLGRNISDEELREVFFEEFDADGDGSIDREEWRTVMDKIISSTQNASDSSEDEKEDE